MRALWATAQASPTDRNEAKRLGAACTLASLALVLSGCIPMTGIRLAAGEEKVLVGPPVRDNRTPMDPALACLGGAIAGRGGKPLVIAVGDVRDYTGKYSVSEGSAITQGGALMVASALGKLRGSVRIAERFDPTIGERELAYTDRRQLGDGMVHELPGPSGKQTVPWLPYYGGSIAASDYYLVGGITEVNYDIRSGGLETGVNTIGPKRRTYTESVAIDLRIVDTRSLLVVRTVSLTKQFTGYETGFGIFRFFGSDLFDINLGAKGQEPLQLGIRTALEEAVLQLVGTVARVDAAACLGKTGWQVPVAATAVTPGGEATRAQRMAAPTVPAFNGPSGSGIGGATSDYAVLFEVGSQDLTAATLTLLDRVASEARHGAVTITIMGRDSEQLDPGKRQALTDQRIAQLMEALARRGIGAAAIAVQWRPDPADPSAQHDVAGLQRLARLRVG